jgi:uncharacterized protein (TIGR02270 family)
MWGGGTQVLENIVSQHAEEAAFLWLQREAAVGDPHFYLKDLVKWDNRVEAHIDGLRIAGEPGWELCVEQLRWEEPGEVFAAGLLALESGERAKLARVLDLVDRVPETARGLISAFGWVPFEQVRETVDDCLRSTSPLLRRLGIAASAIHRIDPGDLLDRVVDDDNPALRARALKAVGELGREDLLPVLCNQLEAEEDGCRFWAAWSAVLLGERGLALKLLHLTAAAANPYQTRALQLVPRLLDRGPARTWLTGGGDDAEALRPLIIAMGVTGDLFYIPHLFPYMEVDDVARVAGEAFSMITGVDLAYEDLEGEWPEGFEAGPTEEPEDENVEMDADEDLPWPAPELIRKWWDGNKDRFRPGRRYLCGAPITAEQCRHVLRTGYQRQRIAAALELALMRPNAPLFETRAPGFRQQRLLAAGTAPGA